MDAWLSTGEAAALLGTSTTTIRTMAARGDLEYRTVRGHERAKWTISRGSVESWLAANGRIDRRRRGRESAPAGGDDGLGRLESMEQQNRYLQADRDRLRDEVVTLRAVALQLRARNDAITEAESYQAQAAKLLLDAARAQSQAADALRRGLEAQDNALGQFLVPGPPNDDLQLKTPDCLALRRRSCGRDLSRSSTS